MLLTTLISFTLCYCCCSRRLSARESWNISRRGSSIPPIGTSYRSQMLADRRESFPLVDRNQRQQKMQKNIFLVDFHFYFEKRLKICIAKRSLKFNFSKIKQGTLLKKKKYLNRCKICRRQYSLRFILYFNFFSMNGFDLFI